MCELRVRNGSEEMRTQSTFSETSLPRSGLLDNVTSCWLKTTDAIQCPLSDNFRFARDTLAIGFSNRLNCIGQPLSLLHDKQVLSTYPMKDEPMMKALIRDRYGPPDVLE